MTISRKKLDYQLQRNLLTGKELAEKAGLSEVVISNIRTGKVKNPYSKTMRAICEVLNCTPDDLLEVEA